MTTTQAIRARKKQSEAILNEQEGQYKRAANLYSVAKVIWERVKNSGKKQSFCDNRKHLCETLALTNKCEDDDDECI